MVVFYITLISALPSLLSNHVWMTGAYGWSCDIAAFVVERIAGTSIEAYWCVRFVDSLHQVLFNLCSCSVLRPMSTCYLDSQEHIFGPLGMDTTFYLTSTVKSRLVDLAVRQPDRSLKKWDGSP